MSNAGDNQPRPGTGGWAPSSAPAQQQPGNPAPAGLVQGYPGQPMPTNPMPVSARPASAPALYGQRPTGQSGTQYPSARQGMPGSAPPGYPPTSAPGGYGPGGYGPPVPGTSGVFAPQHQRHPEPEMPQRGNDKPRGKKKRSLWDAFMGDLGKNKRARGDEAARKTQSRSGKSGGGGPLAAYGSLDNRIDMSAGVLMHPLPGFRVEDGVVVPDDARLKKARRRGPGTGGGRWQRFAFLTAMLLAMALLMVLGVSRLIGGALVADPKLPAGSAFPREAASGYVGQLNKLFYTWDTDSPQQRQQALRMYYPFSVDDRYGWNGKGKQEVRDTPVTLRLDVQSDQRALVVVGMSVVADPGSGDRQTSFLCTATSVYATSTSSIAVDSYPALVACPAPADVGVDDSQVEGDTKNSQDIKDQVQRFFKAYGASDVGLLQNITTDQKVSDGLASGRQFGQVTDIKVPAPPDGADPNLREARVKVEWLQPGNSGGSSQSEYLVNVKRVDGNWKISKLRPALPSAELQPKLSAKQRSDQRESAAPSSGTNDGKSHNNDTGQSSTPAGRPG